MNNQHPISNLKDTWGYLVPLDLRPVDKDSLHPGYSSTVGAYFDYQSKKWFLDKDLSRVATFEQIHGYALSLSNSTNYNSALTNYMINTPGELQKSADAVRQSEIACAKIRTRAEAKVKTMELQKQMRLTTTSFIAAVDGFHVLVKNALGTLLEDQIVFKITIVNVILLTNLNKPYGFYVSVKDPKNSLESSFVIITCDKNPYSAVRNSTFRDFYNPDTKHGKYAWESLLHFLNDNLSCTFETPFVSGWYSANNDSFLFWASRKDLTFPFMPECISDVQLKGVTDNNITIDVIISKIAELSNLASTNRIAALLILRICAIVMPLFNYLPPLPTLCIIGPNALDFAKGILSPVISENDILNLDTDNKATLKKAVNTSSTPLFCYSSSFDDRTSQSRYKAIKSLSDSEKRKNFCVLCLPKLMPNAYLCDLVFEFSDLFADSFCDTFDILSYDLIKKIESSGIHFPERFNMNKLLSTSEMFKIIVSLMEEVYHGSQVTDFLNLGLHLIQQQLSLKGSILLVLFREKTFEAVNGGIVNVMDRHNVPFSSRNTADIFFDEEYYYFTNSCLSLICEFADISDKGILKLKQDLFYSDNLKIYRYSASHKEYLVDFNCEYAAGTDCLSGIAVKADFFDDLLFAIKLKESGGQENVEDDL